MDLKTLGAVMLETLAVQGQITNLEKQISELNLQMSMRNAEDVKRSKQVKQENAVDLSRTAELGKQVGALKQELETRVTELKKNGVDINTAVMGGGSISM